jgi:hypothetical protein
MAGHYLKANVTRVKPGIQNVAFIAKKSDFTTIAAPEPAAVGAARFQIVDSHTFPADKGFMEVVLLNNLNDFASDMKGDAGAAWLEHTIKLAIPGDGPLVQSLIHDLINEDLIVLVKDTNCPDPKYIQFGCECDNGSVSSIKTESGTRGGDKGKMTTFEIKATCRNDYEGTLTLQD